MSGRITRSESRAADGDGPPTGRKGKAKELSPVPEPIDEDVRISVEQDSVVESALSDNGDEPVTRVPIRIKGLASKIPVLDDSSDGEYDIGLEEDEVERLIAKEKAKRQELMQTRQRNAGAAIQQRLAELKRLRASNKKLKGTLHRTTAGRVRNDARQRQMSIETSRAISRIEEEDAISDFDTFSQYTRRAAAGHVKLGHLPRFEAKSLHEVETFISRAERIFRVDEGYYLPTDRKRIDHCVMALSDHVLPMLTRWERTREEEGKRQPEWADFKSFLYDSVTDGVNRPLLAAEEYGKIVHDGYESALKLSSRLETQDVHMANLTDAARMYLFYGKLHPDIQAQIVTHTVSPKNYGEMIALAERMIKLRKKTKNNNSNNNSHKGTKANSQGTDNNHKNGNGGGLVDRVSRSEKKKSDGDNDKSNDKSNNNSSKPKTPNWCRTCTDKHEYKDCPLIRCRECRQVGHRHENCPQKQGKDGARQ